jgi:protein-tyrosine phosphatase
MDQHAPIKILEYNYISDGIYIGTNKCCKEHFAALLLSQNIEVDISVEGESVDEPFGVNFYVWLPVKNDLAPTQEQLNFGVASLEKFVKMKKKIYVHCQNGHSRAPTLVAAYFIKQGKSVEEALEFIKLKRPSVHMRDVQKLALENFQKSL